MTQDLRRAVEDRPTVHDHLVSRAMAAQDAVFGDASVDRARVMESVRELAGRLVAQLEALAKAGYK